MRPSSFSTLSTSIRTAGSSSTSTTDSPVYASVGVLAPLMLLLLRIVQGVAIGGEVPGAWVFVAEHARQGRVGFACACLTSGLTVGILIGSLTAAWINHHLSPEQVLQWGWRLPFLLGGGLGPVVVGALSDHFAQGAMLAAGAEQMSEAFKARAIGCSERFSRAAARLRH